MAIGAKLINARAETVDQKPAYRNSFIHRRCLIPADGFNEWQKVPGGKQPYRITLAGGSPFVFAGLWEQWREPSGGLVFSCTIITCAANELVGPIHQRMPVILTKQVEQAWLNRELKDRHVLKEWLVPYPPEAMTAYPVSTLVNSSRNDDARLILPLTRVGKECMVLAAFIIGSSLIITTKVGPTIYGQPAVGVVGYAFSALLGLGLVIDILRGRR